MADQYQNGGGVLRTENIFYELARSPLITLFPLRAEQTLFQRCFLISRQIENTDCMHLKPAIILIRMPQGIFSVSERHSLAATSIRADEVHCMTQKPRRTTPTNRIIWYAGGPKNRRALVGLGTAYAEIHPPSTHYPPFASTSPAHPPSPQLAHNSNFLFQTLCFPYICRSLQFPQDRRLYVLLRLFRI